jgi:ATP-dependent protease Clp ATPase subunit
MKLIAGPKVNICDECVHICLSIIMEDKAAEAGEPVSEESVPRPSK